MKRLWRSFENDVKMYGTQTTSFINVLGFSFENDVKMYGTQTKLAMIRRCAAFENDVKMYGTQTLPLPGVCLVSV